jgi:hypothetical protein
MGRATQAKIRLRRKRETAAGEQIKGQSSRGIVSLSRTWQAQPEHTLDQSVLDALKKLPSLAPRGIAETWNRTIKLTG